MVSLQYLPFRLRRSLSQAGLIYRSCSHCNYAWIRLFDPEPDLYPTFRFDPDPSPTVKFYADPAFLFCGSGFS